MKKKFTVLFGALAALACSSIAMAAEVEITGVGQCGKCSLKETDSCQNAIVTEVDGKKVTYFLEKNDVSEAFHSKVCKEPADVVAKGTVAEKDGKKILTVTSIGLAKKKD